MTTGSVARTHPRDPGCAAWPTASRRSRDAWKCRVRPGAARACERKSRCPELDMADPLNDTHPVRVVVAEDSTLLREGIASLLEAAGFEVVARSGTAADLLLKVRSYAPAVVTVDIRMPPTHTDEGLRAAREIRADHPDVGILVLSQYAEPAYALELLQESAEGIGYLLKDRVSNIDDFADAVRRVAKSSIRSEEH